MPENDKISFCVAPSIKKALQKDAKKRNISVSEFIYSILREYFKDDN